MRRRLGALDLWVLILAAPAFYFPTLLPPAPVALGLGAGISAWLAARRTARARFWNIPFNLPLLLLLGMLFPSLYASADWMQSLPNLTRIAYGALLYTALGAYLARQSHWTRVYWRVVPAAMLGLAILMLTGIQWGNKFQFLAPLYAHLPRVLDAVPHYAELKGFQPNAIGGFLLLFVPLLWAMAWTGSGSRHRGMDQGKHIRIAPTAGVGTARGKHSGAAPAPGGAGRVPDRRNGAGELQGWGSIRIQPGSILRWGAAGVVTATLVLTQSRSALLGIGVALLAWVVYRCPRARPILLFLLISALGLVAWLGVHPPLAPLTSGDKVGSLIGGMYSLQSRLEEWQRAVYMLQDFSYTGIGLNMFPRVAAVLYPFFTNSPEIVGPHAHNQLLQIGVDLGLPGLVAYAGLITSYFLWTGRAMTSSQDPQTRALAAGLLFGMLAFQVFGLTDAIALGSEPDLVFWIALTLAASLKAEATDPIFAREATSGPELEVEVKARRLPVRRPNPGTRIREVLDEPIWIWLLGSLLSIAFIGGQPHVGLSLALLSGIALGLRNMLKLDLSVAAGPVAQAAPLAVQEP